MIDPQVLDISSLPSVAFSPASKLRLVLPPVPAIYFCLAVDGSVLYIGETKNLWNRWGIQDHGKARTCKKLQCAKIAWCEDVPPNRRDRIKLESELVRKYRPVANGIVKQFRHV